MRSSSSTHRDGALTRRLSGAARPRVRGVAAFRVSGGAGLVAAVAVAFGVVAMRGGSPLAMAAIAVSAVGTFLAVATAHRLVTGTERLVYYHHEIAVLAIAAAVAAALGEPVPASLDAVALGIGAFLAFGRLGCFMVGCCHGRPHRWGVRYGHAHTATGLAPALVGVRLFPVQLAEAALAAVIVTAGLALVVAGGAPGDAFTLYVGAYAVVRFGLEEARGDVDRPHLAGFSQPQWLSLACAGAVALLAAGGAVRWHAWDGAVVAIAAGMGLVALRRRSRAHGAALDPAHLQELAAAIRRTSATGGTLPVVERTSLGLNVSAGPGHVTLSGVVDPSLARALAGYAMGALDAPGHPEVRTGAEGSVHLVAWTRSSLCRHGLVFRQRARRRVRAPTDRFPPVRAREQLGRRAAGRGR